jgi:nucleotide-binding universal stress UspA family protein
MAYPFRAILSPIQFDDLSLPALGFAKSIAKDQGATLHLLHVVAMASALGEPAINATLHSRAEEKAIEALNDIAAKHLEGVSYQCESAAARGVVCAWRGLPLLFETRIVCWYANKVIEAGRRLGTTRRAGIRL